MEEKIREGFAAVVRPELYPDFLAFAGRFPGFGADNLLLAFRQRPGAAALAGRYVWIRLTGIDASPRGEPVSVFYPGYDPDHRRINPVVVSLYDIRQAAGAEVLPDGIADLYGHLCNRDQIRAVLIPWLRRETGRSFYPSDRTEQIEVSGPMVLYPDLLPDEEVIPLLLRHYCDEKCICGSRILSAAVSEGILYAVLSALEGGNKEAFAFPFLKRKDVMENSGCLIVKETLKRAREILLALYLQDREGEEPGGQEGSEGRAGSKERHFVFDFNETCILNQVLGVDSKEEVMEILDICRNSTGRPDYVDALDSLSEKLGNISHLQYEHLKRDRKERRILTWPPYYI